MRSRVDEPRRCAPAWMVSFGDMMTLVLTFFILLVSLSSEQKVGLMARGIGSFIVALKSRGLDGILSAAEQQAVFEHTRRRFNLPPEEDPDERADHDSAASEELLRARSVEGLEPHDEVGYPLVATFAPGEHGLTDQARRYLDRLAPSLAPQRGQVLLLEGHAGSGEGTPGGDTVALAFRRARAVARHLVEHHGFHPDRVRPRAWRLEVQPEGPATRGVDARLLTTRKTPGR